MSMGYSVTPSARAEVNPVVVEDVFDGLDRHVRPCLDAGRTVVLGPVARALLMERRPAGSVWIFNRRVGLRGVQGLPTVTHGAPKYRRALTNQAVAREAFALPCPAIMV